MGGAGTDTVDYSEDGAGITVYLSSGTATDGSGGSDTLSAIETVIGSAYDDSIIGNNGANTLHGGDGVDTLSGGSGADVLYGGSDADIFEFMAASAFSAIDTVMDFDIANDNDVLDISDILDATGYNHGVDSITDWVEITGSGSDSVVKIDRDGTGGAYNMTQIATLEGISGLTDEAALVTSGNLIAA